MTLPSASPYPEASQASTALVLSIIGLVCCGPLAVVAWIMANNELKGIESGRRDPVNQGTASAARVVGIVGVVLWGFGFVLAMLAFGGLFVIPFVDFAP